jgi:hypothetical protein
MSLIPVLNLGFELAELIGRRRSDAVPVAATKERYIRSKSASQPMYIVA